MAPMKAVFATIQSGWGGGEQMLADLAVELVGRGVDVYLVAPRDSALQHHLAALGPPIRGEAYDMLVANDFRSAWRYRCAIRAPQRVLVVHGWWQSGYVRRAIWSGLGYRPLAVSEAVADSIASPGSRWRPSVLPYAPPLARLPARLRGEVRRRRLTELGLPCDRPCLGFIGRYQGVKRPHLFVDVVEACGASGVMATSASFGSVEESRLRIGLHERLSLSSAPITLLEQGSAGPVLEVCDVLVSTSEFESLGIAMLEALALGIPVVTTARGGPADYIEPGRNGWLVPDADAGELAASVGEVMSRSPSRLEGRSISAAIDVMLELE